MPKIWYLFSSACDEFPYPLGAQDPSFPKCEECQMVQNSQGQTNGAFIVNRTYEAAIAGKPRMWTQLLPPRAEGHDRTLREAVAMAWYENVLVEIPNGAEINVVEKEGVGTYGHYFENGDVHLHGTLATTTQPGSVIKANVVVYVLTWEPEGARERGCAKNGKDAFVNYALCIDIYPYEGAVPTADYRLQIVETSAPGTYREQRDILDFGMEGGRFAHLSRDRRRDQEIVICRTKRAADQPTTPLVAKLATRIENPVMNGQVTVNGRGAKPIGGGALAEQLKANGLDPEQFRVHSNN